MRLLHAGPDLLGDRHGRRGASAACRATSPTISAAETIDLDHDELRERMSGNLCRCGAYNGIVEAIAETFARQAARSERHDALHLRARRRRRRCGAAWPRGAGAKYLGGGTNLVDLMRETIERPTALVDVTGLSDAIEETRRRRPADRRGGHEHRASPTIARCASAIRCWRARSWPARRRRSATWRRSAATCCSARAAPISTTTPRAATSARPARAATRSTASTASTRSSAPRRPASPPIRRTCAWRWRRSTRSCICEGPSGARHAAARRLPSPARRHARDRDRAGSPAS